jgi:GT2 family glycosyltransferase
MTSISAVIPTWNRADLLESILINLRAQTRPPEQIVVVDNGSTDATQIVARQFGVDLVVFAQNRGFAVAVNEGIRRSKGEWILLLNNDVVLEPQWIERLLAATVESNAAFAAGKLLRKDKTRTLDGSWDLVSRAAYAWRCGYGRPDGEIWSTPRRIWMAPMTAVLFHTRVFEQIGLLDDRFESYYEDVDFGVRCALAGLSGIYEPAAVAVHMDKASSGKKRGRVMYLTGRNQLLILAKHYPAATLRRFAWPIFIGQILALMAAAKQGHPFAALKGKCEALWRWRTFREPRDGPIGCSPIEAAMLRSEVEIYDLQRKIGYDIYWRLYFSLVRPS